MLSASERSYVRTTATLHVWNQVFNQFITLMLPKYDNSASLMTGTFASE